MYKAFEQAKALAMERMENPRIVPLAWYAKAGGAGADPRTDPWQYG